MLLASTAAPAVAEQQAAQAAAQSSEIVVTATRELRAAVEGVDPERNVDADAVAAYGAGTVGEVLAEIAREMGDGDDEPALYVNGVPIADPGDIVDYPAEAIERIDVLPRGTGARLGKGANKRAYNVVLKRSFASTIGVLSDRFATEGGWNAATGEVFFTRIAGSQRLNITARIADESLLRESDRGLFQPEPPFAYDITGNVLPAPGRTEIDPRLSALSGFPVAIAALPGEGRAPALADLVRAAGIENRTELGLYRSLKPATRRYSLGFTGNQPIAEKLSGVLTARWDRDEFESWSGLRAGLLVLPAGHPSSVLDSDVTIARYDAGTPLGLDSATERANVDLTLNSQRGEWLVSLRGGWRHFAYTSESDRQDNAPSQPIVLGEGENVFARDISVLLPVSTERSRSSTRTFTVNSLASGPVLPLPAGQLRAALTAGWTDIGQRGQTRGPFFNSDREVDRTEWLGSVSLEIPLVSPEMPGLGAIGTLTADLDYAATRVPGLGTIERKGAGLAWNPTERFNLRAGLNTDSRLPDPSQLGDPRTESENVRYFDPLRRETVDVFQISGGNPALVDEQFRTLLFSASWEAVRAAGLRLTAEYVRTELDNPIVYLPPSSTDILAAFPQRFVRDGSGRLVSVDVRPVNFVERQSERLRWGATFQLPLSPGLKPDAEGKMPPLAIGQPRWRLTGSLNHAVELSDTVVLRAGLPALDLLEGGAIGFGGSVPRHRVDMALGANDREVGARLSARWRSDSLLNSGTPSDPTQIVFGSHATFDLRAFADLGQVFTAVTWLKKTKLTVDVVNLFNQRQAVADSSGLVPLHYQPAYRDPLGRTIQFELRRQF